MESRYIIQKDGKIINANTGRTLKPDITKKRATSYERVTLCNNGETKRHMVHRLVATKFIPNHENKPFVNHIDNNGRNNHVDNLEWCTHKENMAHSAKQGRKDKVKSLGGIAQGKIAREKKIKRLLGYVGKKVNGFLVIQFDSFEKHPFATVACLKCGYTESRTFAHIEKGETKWCRKCKYRHISETRRKNYEDKNNRSTSRKTIPILIE